MGINLKTLSAPAPLNTARKSANGSFDTAGTGFGFLTGFAGGFAATAGFAATGAGAFTAGAGGAGGGGGTAGFGAAFAAAGFFLSFSRCALRSAAAAVSFSRS